MTASTPASSRAPRQDNRRQQLLDVAARLFRERGYHVTSMRDIAREVGMLSGSIYYHFPSKEEMLLAVYEVNYVGRFLYRCRARFLRPDVGLHQSGRTPIRRFQWNMQLRESRRSFFSYI